MEQKPPITISSLDAGRLEKMLDSLGGKQIPNEEELRVELERANIVEPEDMPDDVVTMNSTVIFRMESSSKEFALTLVYPVKRHPGLRDKATSSVTQLSHS